MARKKRPPRILAQSIQVSVRVKRPKGVTISPQLLQEAVNNFIDNGVLAPGFEITAVIWHKEYQSHTKDYEYTDPDKIPDVLDAARRAGLIPSVFSLASD